MSSAEPVPVTQHLELSSSAKPQTADSNAGAAPPADVDRADEVSIVEPRPAVIDRDPDFVPPPVIVGIDEPSLGHPPVIAGIEDPGVSGRLSSSIAELTNRVTLAVRDSSSSVSRAIKNAVPAAQVRSASPCPMIVCFGDSITERGAVVTNTEWGTGWSARLADDFATRADVLSRGFSGYTSRNAIQFLRKAMHGPAEHATVVLVWFGANDAVLQGRGTQHVSIEEYSLNLSKIVFEIRDLRKVNPIVPVLITPPPIQQELVNQAATSRGDTGGPTRTNENTSIYARACMDVGKRMRTPCIDMFTAMSDCAGDQEGLKRLLIDGLHLSDEGNRFVAETICSQLRAKIGILPDETVKRWFPPWIQVNAEDLQ
jgi:isoamyl acetate esterase